MLPIPEILGLEQTQKSILDKIQITQRKSEEKIKEKGEEKEPEILSPNNKKSWKMDFQFESNTTIFSIYVSRKDNK